MPIYRAKELCPHGIFIGGHHEESNRFSERVFAILASVSPSVEQASLDEAYVDLRGCERIYGLWSAPPIARLPFLKDADGVYRRSERRAVPLPLAGSPRRPGARREMLPEGSRWVGAVAVWIKRRVRAETGLDVSVGVGANKLVAKAASDFGKPSGVTLVEAGREGTFLGLLELKDIPGVGRPCGRSSPGGTFTRGGGAAAARGPAAGRLRPGARAVALRPAARDAGGAGGGARAGPAQEHQPGDHVLDGHQRL